MDTGNSSRTFHRGSIRSGMNEKFYDLKKEKQDRMINAGLRIFALNGYHHASTDEIVKEAKISKGLLFHYKPTKATVTVDGVTKSFGKVWLAPTMNGRYYGGGMNIAPAQDRLNPERTVSAVVLYGSGKLKTLMVFPSIFKGEHIRHTEMVSVMTGHEVTVKFDRPVALQIDGELVLNVTEYTVRGAIGSASAEKAAAVPTEA